MLLGLLGLLLDTSGGIARLQLADHGRDAVSHLLAHFAQGRAGLADQFGHLLARMAHVGGHHLMGVVEVGPNGLGQRLDAAGYLAARGLIDVGEVLANVLDVRLDGVDDALDGGPAVRVELRQVALDALADLGSTAAAAASGAADGLLGLPGHLLDLVGGLVDLGGSRLASRLGFSCLLEKVVVGLGRDTSGECQGGQGQGQSEEFRFVRHFDLISDLRDCTGCIQCLSVGRSRGRGFVLNSSKLRCEVTLVVGLVSLPLMEFQPPPVAPTR